MKIPKKIAAILLVAVMPLVSSAQDLTGKTLGANEGKPGVSVPNVVAGDIVSPTCPYEGVTDLNVLFAAAGPTQLNSPIILNTAITLQFLGFSDNVVAAFMSAALCELWEAEQLQPQS